ncbi:MAG: hypothetical protein MUF21_04295 [Gemmatimonadaceae bacterium]|nr:hypothetical protein [Gemmatimonadaceae bacterium]
MSSARSGAAARAAALTARARALGVAQAEVHSLTMREIAALAAAAVRFFDTLPLAEFSGSLLPASARSARRLRHKVLHQSMVADETGATLRALLLGRDAQLRLFTARSTVARDFLTALEPRASALAGINRDVAEWSPRTRQPEFRAADVIDRLTVALDDVERRLHHAERRVAAQREALATGDMSRIRESLGPATTAKPAAPALPATTGGATRPPRRATPLATARVIAPRPATPALPAGAAAAADIGPGTSDIATVPAPATADPAPAAASTGAAPGTAAAHAPRAPVVTGDAPLRAIEPVATVEPAGPTTPPPAAPTAAKGASWLSRAARAALRPPR